MSIERIYYCDGPANHELPPSEDDKVEERCPSHVRSAQSGLPGGFIRIAQGRGEYGPALHFCSWGCVMRYAAEQPIPEYITITPEDMLGEGEGA